MEKLYASVSLDFLETVADSVFTSESGDKIKYRLKDGNIDTDLLLYTLGFNWDYKNDKASYEMLTEDVRYLRVYDSTGVFVRDFNTAPYNVRKMLVYTGLIRNNYAYKDLYRNGEVLVGDFTVGGELFNISDIGTEKHYNSSKYVPVEHRQLDSREYGETEE